MEHPTARQGKLLGTTNDDKNTSDSDDISITQDIKVVQQILNKVLKNGDGSGVTLNVVTIGQITNNYLEDKTPLPKQISLEDEELREIQELVMKLLALIPETQEGRLEAIQKLVLATCLEMFDTDAEAAEYLGISRRMMSYNKKKLNPVKDNK